MTTFRPRPPHALALVLAAAMGLLSLATAHSPAAPATPAGTPAAGPVAEDARPNIVLITGDDMTEVELRWMPRTRRQLARTGVRFSDMVAPHPNCCPSRAQMLTGQYAQNNGVATNQPPNGGHDSLQPATALPVWLRNAGYQTGFVGKYLHGYDEQDAPEPGWDRFRPVITKPLSAYYGVVQMDDGELTRWPDDVYHTDLVRRQSSAMIDDFAAGDRPFFLWSSYVAPHGSCAPGGLPNCSGPPPAGPDHPDDHSDVRLPSLDSPSFNERDMSDKPGFLRRASRVSAEVQQTLFTARLRALASLDDAVAETVAALDRAGELENTVVVFTSDNGYLFGEHRQTGKVLAYEESIGVPLVVRGPGVPAGEVRRQTVATIDLAPTFARLAGAAPLVRVDGIDVWKYATRDAAQRDRALLVQAGGSRPGRWQYRAVRTGRYTYVDWPQMRRDELYDRRRDPWQLDSVARVESYAPVQRRLERVLLRLESCAGARCQVPARLLPR